MVDCLSVVKAAEKFTDDATPWDEKFKALCASSIKEQADAFKLRFAMQFDRQGIDCKEMVKKVNAAAEIFGEKTKSGNGKSLKYAGVEFGDVLKEFLPESNMSFVQRKAEFKDFDLDGNGYIDLVEFLLFLYKDKVLDGYKARHGLAEIPEGKESEAMIKEFVNITVLVDTKLDENVLGLAKLKEQFDADMQLIRDEAKTEVKKRQLTNNLSARETKYEEDLKGFWSSDQIGKKKATLLKNQEKHLRDLENSIDKEASDALKPKKNLKIPG